MEESANVDLLGETLLSSRYGGFAVLQISLGLSSLLSQRLQRAICNWIAKANMQVWAI